MLTLVPEKAKERVGYVGSGISRSWAGGSEAGSNNVRQKSFGLLLDHSNSVWSMLLDTTQKYKKLH